METTTTPAPAATTAATPDFNYNYFKGKVGKKLRLTFDNAVRRRGMSTTATTVTIRVFENSDSIGVLTGHQKRKGSYLDGFLRVLGAYGLAVLDVKELSTEKKEQKKLTPLECWEKVTAKLHPNAWKVFMAEDKARLERGETLYADYYERPRFRDITKIFSPWERETQLFLLQQAFDTCTAYHYRKGTNSNGGRDFSIEVKPMPGGGVQAWFSSEYKGCGNGDYYLLLNPTTAVFGEKD